MIAIDTNGRAVRYPTDRSTMDNDRLAALVDQLRELRASAPEVPVHGIVTTRPRDRWVRRGILAAGALLMFGMGHASGVSEDPPSREHDAAVLDVLRGDSPDRGVLTGAETYALRNVYAVEETTGGGCYTFAAELIVTRDYREVMRPCFGEEDSAVVSVILSGGVR